MSLVELLNKPIAELSSAELEQVMAHKRAEERKALDTAREAYQQDKEAYIGQLLDAFKEQAETLKKIKGIAINEGLALNNRIYEINGKTPKEDQKTFTIKNEDDTARVVIDRQERFEFTEEAQVHITAIKDLFKEKFEQRNKGFYALLDSILMRNSKGDYDAKLLTKARLQVRKIGDEALISEFDKLQDCMRVVGTSTYIRVYERDENKKWRDISLNFSSI
ncbi:DUF3164 family protein [Riemerella columbipharyngis]|uniref:DUF3164 domain-containing protein n=1 Tax=Riemerella columbipharyngis TaxID=1071918 RepID=A0A1G7FC44_9FLAO|nr:DUF3164 family protein [Riemerella columbipharyngis]SDE73436.1 Protein of unknown function [Riemerella columbipharyngis]